MYRFEKNVGKNRKRVLTNGDISANICERSVERDKKEQSEKKFERI